jgi:transcription initiation factor TFIIE subunit alpha
VKAKMISDDKKNLAKDDNHNISEKSLNDIFIKGKINNDILGKKMTKNLEKIKEELILELSGDEGLRIVEFIKDKEDTSEFVISEKLSIEIHQTRTLLYKLLDYNLTNFIRRKDKIKGWYICYWNFNPEELIHTYNKLKTEKIEKLNERLNKEKGNQFFMCGNACIRMPFEKAVDFEFKCPECGELMNQQDNARTIEFLKERITELQKEMDQVN